MDKLLQRMMLQSGENRGVSQRVSGLPGALELQAAQASLALNAD